MAGPANVSTDRGLSIQWWYGVAVGAAVWALLMATTDREALLGAGVYDAITLLALLAWPLIPVATYLDLRKIRERAAWEPATKSWLLAAFVPIVNVPAGVAYCVRRSYAVRGTLPSENWRYVVYAGLLAWIGLVAADVVVDYVSIGALEPIVFGPVLFVVWLGFPVAIYLDAVRYSRYPDKRPRFRALVLLSAVPLLSVLVGAAYVGGRWWHRRTLDPGVEPSVPGTGPAGSGRPEPISPWYRRAAVVFAGYFLAVVALGSLLSLEADLEWNVLGLLVWPAFGVVFTACVHLDLRAVREAGVPWGGTRYFYYLSTLVPAPAFYYLLSRLTKVNRARSNGLIEDGDGGEGDGGEGDDEGEEGRREPDGSDTAPAEGDVGRTSSSEGTPEPDGADAGESTDVGDGTGFEWGGGSRG